MYKVGITGGIGSGKSRVCSILEGYGVAVYDADSRAKGLMRDSLVLRDALVARFGQDVYTNEGIWKYILTFASVWKETGYGMIFYLAAITGINPELYEAARVDGCGIMQRIRYITLPLIKPTTCILLLLSLGGILKGNMDMFYNLVGNNGFLYNATDVIDTYVYRSMLQLNDYGVTGAIGLFQSVIGFVLVVSVNTITKKLDSDSAMF